jgi:hypothetical protein
MMIGSFENKAAGKHTALDLRKLTISRAFRMSGSFSAIVLRL